MPKSFKQLSEREILALAMSLEGEDGRIYADFADALRESYPATAAMFEEMRAEEAGHAIVLSTHIASASAIIFHSSAATTSRGSCSAVPFGSGGHWASIPSANKPK